MIEHFMANNVTVCVIVCCVFCLIFAVGIIFAIAIACKWLNRKFPKFFDIVEHCENFNEELIYWMKNTVPGSFTLTAIYLLIFIKIGGFIFGFLLFCSSYNLLKNCLNYIKNED